MNIYIIKFNTGGDEFEEEYSSINAIFDSEDKAIKYRDEMNDILDKLGIYQDGNDSKVSDYKFCDSQEVIDITENIVIFPGAYYDMHGPYEVNCKESFPSIILDKYSIGEANEEENSEQDF